MNNTSNRSVVADALWGQLETTVERGSVRPPPRLSLALEMCRPGAVSTPAEVARLLEREPGLATVVHRSVSYGSTALETAEQPLALVLEGWNMAIVRDLVFENALRQDLVKFAVGCRDVIVQIRRHSIIAGHLTRAICARASIDTKFAFVAGLLHDIGMVVLLGAVDCVEGIAEVPLPPLWPYLCELHEPAARYVAEHWNLPKEIRDAIADHHSPSETSSTLGVAVALSDELTECFAASIKGPYSAPVDGVERRAARINVLDICKARLRLSDGDLQDIVRDVKGTVPRTLWMLDA